jgi:peptide/nickel transport system substrate-binding protein
MRQQSMTPRSSLAILLTVVALMVGWSHGLSAQPQPAGELVIAWPITIVPTWFDPAETPAQITPFGILYALHDGLVRPLPGEPHGQQPGHLLDREPRWPDV